MLGALVPEHPVLPIQVIYGQGRGHPDLPDWDDLDDFWDDPAPLQSVVYQ